MPRSATKMPWETWNGSFLGADQGRDWAGDLGRGNQFAPLVSTFYNAINAGIIVKNISMDGSVPKLSSAVRTLRWLARILSILSVGIFLLFAIGEGFNPFRFTAQESILFLFFPFGVCLGMIMAWRWEGLGGGITVTSLVAFYLVHRLLTPNFPKGCVFVVLAVPGLLFLLCWLCIRLTTRQREVSPPQ